MTAMAFSEDWLLKGHFDFSGQNPRQTTTLAIRERLRTALELPGLEMAAYPTGPKFRHTYWWRERDIDYAEAQFVMSISKQHPILSLGVSVEKGVDKAVAKRPEQVLDRAVWDWDRLVERFESILTNEIPQLVDQTSGPVQVRIRSRSFANVEEPAWRSRVFSFASGSWFERHAGQVHVEPRDIAALVRDFDQQTDTWVIVQLTRDLTPIDVNGRAPSDVADMLIKFDSIRRRLRP